MPDNVFDLCVVGGGPAGAVAAIHTAQAGHRVCLIERTSFPRAHAGESLSPGVVPLLDSLGLIACLERALFIRSRESILCWDTVQPTRVSSPNDIALVDRGAFDRALLEVAVAAGVFVIQPAVASVAEGRDYWRIAVHGAARDSLRARLVVDASGRLGCRRLKRLAVSPPTVAVWGVIDAVAPAATQIEALSDGWLWAAPVASTQLSIMFVTDPATVRSALPGAPGDLLRERLSQSTLLRSFQNRPFTRSVRVCDAACSLTATPIASGYLLAGEASYTIDPLSATGIEKAIQSGVAAGSVVNTLLRHQERSALCTRFFEKRQREDAATHSRWASDAYRAVARYADRPFWATRRTDRLANAAPPTAPMRDDRLAYGTHLCLGPDVRITDEPCMVNGIITSRPAVSSPGLPRPVAFVDGVEVAPLLTALDSRPTLDDLSRQWSRQSSPAQTERIAKWLWDRYVICAVPSKTGEVRPAVQELRTDWSP
jgi:flavin-dependent dehydrogenase